MTDYRDPRKNGLWKLFFLFAGISTLFVWNSVLSLTSYWAAKIAPGIEHYYGFPFMFGSFVCFFCFDSINRKISYAKQIYVWPLLMVSIFGVYFVLGEFVPNPTVKSIVFLIGCFVQGFINNILQMSQSRFVMSFTFEEIRLYNAGTGIAGMGASFLNYGLTYVPVSVTWQFILYLLLVLIVLATIIAVDLAFTKHFINPKDVTEAELSEPLMIEKQEEGFDSKKNELLNRRKEVYNVINRNEGADTWTHRIQVWKKLYPVTTLMWWCYVVTLGVFPVLAFKVGAAFPTVHNFAFVTLVYNIGDYVGKCYSNLLPMHDGKAYYVYGSSRGLILCVVFAFCVMWVENPFWGSPIFTIIMQLLLGLTNGHFTTITFGIAAGRVKPEEIGTGAGLIVLHLLFGLVFGSLVDALAYM